MFWSMRFGCHGVSRAQLIWKCLGIAGQLERLPASTAEAM